jgi:MFS family permease
MIEQPPASLLRVQSFILFWTARTAATVALNMQVVAIGWQLYDLTSDPLDLGLAGLAQFIPGILLFLIAGHVADRHDRRAVVSLGNIAEAAAAAMLAAGTAGGWLTREFILGAVVLFGAARAFEAPTFQALLPGIVPVTLFPRAVAGSSSAHQVATIVGPALGGLLYVLSPTLVYAACSGLFLLSAVLVALLKVTRAPAKREPMSIAALFGGIAYMRRAPVVLGAISLDLFAVLVGGAMALLPVFARDVFAAGPWMLGILRAMPAIGALLTALLLMRWPVRRRAGRVMFGAVAIYAVTTVVFALSASLPLTLLALVVLGGADVVSVVIRQTLVQLRTPDEMRGRVSAVNMMFIGTSNQLGDFRAGLAAALLGTVPAVAVGGIGTLVVLLVWIRAFPALFRADRLDSLESSGP